MVIYLYFCTMGSVITLPLFLRQPVWPDTPTEWVMVLAIILVSVTGQLLMNQGFFYCRGWEGGVFMSSEVVFTAIVGISFLGDPASWRFWARRIVNSRLYHRNEPAAGQWCAAGVL